MSEFKEAIKELMEVTKWEKKTIAKLLGVHPSYLSSLLRDESSVRGGYILHAKLLLKHEKKIRE